MAHRASSIVLLTTTGGEGGVFYKPLRTLSVSLGGYAIALDWSEGGSGGNGDKALYLQGTTNILDLLFWEVDNGRQLRVTSEMRDVSWSTYNCPVGWPLLGLFSGGKHAHEVGSSARSLSFSAVLVPSFTQPPSGSFPTQDCMVCHG